jgi:hypothetical protein
VECLISKAVAVAEALPCRGCEAKWHQLEGALSTLARASSRSASAATLSVGASQRSGVCVIRGVGAAALSRDGEPLTVAAAPTRVHLHLHGLVTAPAEAATPPMEDASPSTCGRRQ